MTVATCKREIATEHRLHSSRCSPSSSPSEFAERRRISDISSRIFSPTTVGFDMFDIFEEPNSNGEIADVAQKSQPRVVHHRVTEGNAVKLLSNSIPDTSRVRIVSIAGPGTTSPLSISFDHACLLWENFDLEPEFRDIICSFGSAPGCGRAGSSGSFLKSYQDYNTENDDGVDRNITVCGYILQYLEENARSEQKPWSHRHSALYHRHIPANTRRSKAEVALDKPLDVFVLLHSTYESTFAREVRSLRGSPPLSAGKDLYRRLIQNPFSLHDILFQICLSDWAWYLRFTGIAFERASDKLMTTYHPSEMPHVLDYEAFRELRQSLDDILAADSYCRGSRDAVEMFEDLRKMLHQPIKPEWLATLRRQYQGHIRGLTSLQARLENSLAVFEYSFNLKTDHISTEMNQRMLNISDLTFELTRATQELTQTAVEDSAAIRVITVVSLFFLPGAFMSSIFGMNFFDFDGQTNSMVIGSNLWWYIASWLVLTLLTFVAVEIFDRKRRAVSLFRSKSGFWSSGSFSRTPVSTMGSSFELHNGATGSHSIEASGYVRPFANRDYVTARRSLGQGTV